MLANGPSTSKVSRVYILTALICNILLVQIVPQLSISTSILLHDLVHTGNGRRIVLCVKVDEPGTQLSLTRSERDGAR